ncbi:hypothetical protein V8D89_007717 [Ganoderma adspersum]
MPSTLSPPRHTKRSAVFATLMTVALAASASHHQPGSSAHEAILPRCSWSERYVNASAAFLPSAVHRHVRGLHSPSAALEPDSLHCCGFRSPPSPLCVPRVRSLMPAPAWEDDQCHEEDSDSDSSRRDPELWPHDVTAVLSSDQELTAAMAESLSHSPPALSWMAEVSERHSRGALDAGGGICLPRSSAAPAMRELELELALRSSSAGTGRRGLVLRRSPPPTSSAAHASPESALGSLTDAGSSFLGALYDSYSLWELASVLAAIAWLLVCLAA